MSSKFTVFTRSALIGGALLTGVLYGTGQAQTADQPPVIVQPGAPGQPTRVLPADTRAVLIPYSKKDIEFMQGMIMHHGQAVEMVGLMEGRTENKELRLLGARISHSQAEEMMFMRRWLAARGQPAEMPAAMSSGHRVLSMPGMNMSGPMLMPGMLSPAQMAELKNAKGREFDRLFLTGMIRHHRGALTMVQELFDVAGSGQDSEIFNFATDVDSGQRAEIKIMQDMLEKNIN